MDLPLVIALLGMTGGVRIGRVISSEKLRRAFGWFVLGVAAFVFARNRAAFALIFSSESQ
jgi:uncharacterized membrane protein YfcA